MSWNKMTDEESQEKGKDSDREGESNPKSFFKHQTQSIENFNLNSIVPQVNQAVESQEGIEGQQEQQPQIPTV